MRTVYWFGLLSALALGVLLSPSRASVEDKTKDLIVGKWVPAKDDGKTKVVMEFTKDGKVLIEATVDGQTAKLTGTYKVIAEDKVEVEMEIEGKKMKETDTVKVTKEELTLTDPKDKAQTFKRLK
jgi:uncharacterized protein (TIGR03066 family)